MPPNGIMHKSQVSRISTLTCQPYALHVSIFRIGMLSLFSFRLFSPQSWRSCTHQHSHRHRNKLVSNSCFCSAWRERGPHSQNGVLCNCLQLIKEGILLEVLLATLQLTEVFNRIFRALFGLADCRHFALMEGRYLVKNPVGNWKRLSRSQSRALFLPHEFNIFAIWELSVALSCILRSAVFVNTWMRSFVIAAVTLPDYAWNLSVLRLNRSADIPLKCCMANVQNEIYTHVFSVMF